MVEIEAAEVPEGPVESERCADPIEHDEIGSPSDEPDTDSDDGPAVIAADRLITAMRVALNMGLSVTSTNTGGHAENSYHFRSPCREIVINGRRRGLCRAFDVGAPGNPDSLYRRYFRELEQMRPTELFYDPMGYSWKNGSRVGWIVGGHRNHVHVAF